MSNARNIHVQIMILDVFKRFTNSVVLMCCMFLVAGIQAAPLKIHISASAGDDKNSGKTPESAVRTLKKGLQIAKNTSADSYEMLLKGGDTFKDMEPMAPSRRVDSRKMFAFIWDINKPCLISTYGPEEKARLIGGKPESEGGPTHGLLVVDPSSKKVLIENLHIEMFQMGAIFVAKSEIAGWP